MTDEAQPAAGESAANFAARTTRAEPGLEIANTSRMGAMLWIGFYTFLLNIVTLTIFRFWGRTHFRRRLWADTRIGGEALEYTGRGLELFLGFIIAIFTLMVPTIAAVFGAQLLLGPQAMIAVIIPIYLLLFVIIGVAIFLARRYHLSRTTYRGIRFGQTGSAWGFGFAAFGYGVLSVLTLGWFSPAAQIRLSRRLWSNAWYGGVRFKFEDTEEAKKEPVYLSFALAWVGGIVVYGAWVGWLMSSGVAGRMDPVAPDFGAIGLLYASFIPAALLIAVFVAWHFAVITRRITKSLRLDGLTFSSRLSTFDIIELSITNFLLIVFTLGIGLMAAQMRMWKRLANRMTLSGALDFAAIEQSTIEAPKQGEGLADGLDLVSNF
ncbi:MAG TPA: hypothetical protein DDZ68_05255 [Parvularcula sp.]|nr:hypothetical protein [Parvularcula sp.]HBS31439.1 hypothetical protein [Parvularcula sp.]HBS34453.1 hypothetical protein [Parvularcula sp.]